MAEKDTRFGGMMEVASSPAAKKEFHKEFKTYQTKKDNDKGGGDAGGGLLSPPSIIETKKEPPKKEKISRFRKRKLKRKLKKEPLSFTSLVTTDSSLLSIPKVNIDKITQDDVLNNEPLMTDMQIYQKKIDRIIEDYIPLPVQNTVGVSYALASAAITGNINLEQQITDKATINFKVNDWGENVAVIFNLTLGGE